MSDKCELLETCGFFLNFTAHSEVIKMRWIALYCEHKPTSELCERKKFRKQTEMPPADNMAPTGRLM